MKPCRCGWSGEGDHPCHRCGKKPGTSRFYPPSMKFSLAGAQPKLSVLETWGCDECWNGFRKETDTARQKEVSNEA